MMLLPSWAGRLHISIYSGTTPQPCTIRRNFVLDEGDVFDELLLRRSISRINRSGLFDPIDERHVIVHPDEKTGFSGGQSDRRRAVVEPAVQMPPFPSTQLFRGRVELARGIGECLKSADALLRR